MVKMTSSSDLMETLCWPSQEVVGSRKWGLDEGHGAAPIMWATSFCHSLPCCDERILLKAGIKISSSLFKLFMTSILSIVIRKVNTVYDIFPQYANPEKGNRWGVTRGRRKQSIILGLQFFKYRDTEHTLDNGNYMTYKFYLNLKTPKQ